MAPTTRPLVVTADGALLDEVLGIAGAAGIAVDVAVDLAAARPQWTSAAIVLAGVDVAPGLADMPVRTQVLAVGLGPPPGRLPVEDAFELPAEEARLLARLAAPAELDRAASVIAVLPGRGGAGASTLAAALALTAAERGDVSWLVDLDLLGGGADSVLGGELAAGVRWSDLAGAAGRVSSRALRQALPDVRGVAVLSCDAGMVDEPQPAAVSAVLDAARRGGGTVVLDLPRQPTPARATALAMAGRVVVVVPAEVRAVLAARQVVTGLESVGAGVDLVVRAVAGGLPPGEVARAVELPLAGVLDDEQPVRVAGLTGAVDHLAGRGSIGRLCAELLGRLPATVAA